MNKLKHFWYSKKQDETSTSRDCLGSKSNRDNYKAEVFIDGEWKRYSEMSCNKKKHGWSDAIYLGMANEWYIKINGVVQHKDLMIKKELH